MRYGVLECRHCRRVQIAETARHASACLGCGKRVALAEVRYLHRAETQEEARSAVIQITSTKGGLGIDEVGALLASEDARPRGTMEDALRQASSAGDFAEGNFVAAWNQLLVAGDPYKGLEALVRENRVFQPRPGTYRVV